MKKKIRKIQIIFDGENWLRKSDLGTYLMSHVKASEFESNQKSICLLPILYSLAEIYSQLTDRSQNSTPEVTLSIIYLAVLWTSSGIKPAL